MPLFTILLEYLGGSYVGQARGTDAQSGVASCARSFSRTRAVPGVGEAELRDALEAAEPIEVNSVHNVWCCTALIRDELALVNIVLTVD
jgi:hypothetical protein